MPCLEVGLPSQGMPWPQMAGPVLEQVNWCALRRLERGQGLSSEKKTAQVLYLAELPES